VDRFPGFVKGARLIRPKLVADFKVLELQTAKEILAEVFNARPGELEEMIEMRLKESMLEEEYKERLWPAMFCLVGIMADFYKNAIESNHESMIRTRKYKNAGPLKLFFGMGSEGFNLVRDWDPVIESSQTSLGSMQGGAKIGIVALARKVMCILYHLLVSRELMIRTIIRAGYK
jgi:hypothetical protein